MQDAYSRIKEIEKEIKIIKSQFHLGKASLDYSKKRVLQLERQLLHLANKLPNGEREAFLRKKHFGDEIL